MHFIRSISIIWQDDLNALTELSQCPCYRFVTITSLHLICMCNTIFNLTWVHSSCPLNNVIFSHNGKRNLLLLLDRNQFNLSKSTTRKTLLYYKYIKGLLVFRITWFSTRYPSMGLLPLCHRLFYDIDELAVSSLHLACESFKLETSPDNPIVAAWVLRSKCHCCLHRLENMCHNVPEIFSLEKKKSIFW